MDILNIKIYFSGLFELAQKVYKQLCHSLLRLIKNKEIQETIDTLSIEERDVFNEIYARGSIEFYLDDDGRDPRHSTFRKILYNLEMMALIDSVDHGSPLIPCRTYMARRDVKDVLKKDMGRKVRQGYARSYR
jgi:hypothetical protein